MTGTKEGQTSKKINLFSFCVDSVCKETYNVYNINETKEIKMNTATTTAIDYSSMKSDHHLAENLYAYDFTIKGRVSKAHFRALAKMASKTGYTGGKFTGYIKTCRQDDFLKLIAKIDKTANA